MEVKEELEVALYCMLLLIIGGRTSITLSSKSLPTVHLNKIPHSSILLLYNTSFRFSFPHLRLLNFTISRTNTPTARFLLTLVFTPIHSKSQENETIYPFSIYSESTKDYSSSDIPHLFLSHYYLYHSPLHSHSLLLASRSHLSRRKCILARARIRNLPQFYLMFGRPGLGLRDSMLQNVFLFRSLHCHNGEAKVQISRVLIILCKVPNDLPFLHLSQ